MHKPQLLRIMCKNSINKVAHVLATILLVRHIRQPPKMSKLRRKLVLLLSLLPCVYQPFSDYRKSRNSYVNLIRVIRARRLLNA